jgi:hypothetical protein
MFAELGSRVGHKQEIIQKIDLVNIFTV